MFDMQHTSGGRRCHARPNHVHERVEGPRTFERGASAASLDDGRKVLRCAKPRVTSRSNVASKPGLPLRIPMGTRPGMHVIPSRILLGTDLGNGTIAHGPLPSWFPSIHARARAWNDPVSDPLQHHRARTAHVCSCSVLVRMILPSPQGPSQPSPPLAVVDVTTGDSSSLPPPPSPFTTELFGAFGRGSQLCFSDPPPGRGRNRALVHPRKFDHSSGTDRPTVSISRATREHVRACWASLASREP